MSYSSPVVAAPFVMNANAVPHHELRRNGTFSGSTTTLAPSLVSTNSSTTVLPSQTASLPVLPETPATKPQVAAPSPFQYKGARKHHGFPMRSAPYPLPYNREFLDLDVLDCSNIALLKGGTSFINFSGTSTPKRSLDLGCGTGTWVLETAKLWKDCHFTGFDLVPVQLNLKLIDPKAVPEDKWDLLFEEIARVLRPGGAFEIIEEDILFPALPRSFTAQPRSRQHTGGSSRPSTSTSTPPSHHASLTPKHDHALLEYLYHGIFERRFINLEPTAILLNFINIYFRNVYAGPQIEFPYPPPPKPRKPPSNPDSVDSSPTVEVGASWVKMTDSQQTSPITPAIESKQPEGECPRRNIVVGTALLSGIFADGKLSEPMPRPQPLANFSNMPPRTLALHLYRAYQTVLACREIMWEELELQRKGKDEERTRLTALGWVEDDPEGDRAQFDGLVQRYDEDMQARTSLSDTLEALLDWEPPRRAPLTKAQMAAELDRERERMVARKVEALGGGAIQEASLASRSIRAFCGFKEGKWVTT